MEERGKLPVRVDRILLTGFMGAGKSTVGALLAQRLRWRFLDSDRTIEERAGKTIAQIFRSEGEPAFRAIEAQAIQDLSLEERVVLSLGGGAIETEATRELLFNLPDSCIVFLDAPLDVLLRRCRKTGSGPIRPILEDADGVAARWAARRPHYQRAHLTIATAGLDSEGVVTHIVQELESRLREATSP